MQTCELADSARIWGCGSIATGHTMVGMGAVGPQARWLGKCE
jgi:hypothetical protein